MSDYTDSVPMMFLNHWRAAISKLSDELCRGNYPPSNAKPPCLLGWQRGNMHVLILQELILKSRHCLCTLPWLECTGYSTTLLLLGMICTNHSTENSYIPVTLKDFLHYQVSFTCFLRRRVCLMFEKKKKLPRFLGMVK